MVTIVADVVAGQTVNLDINVVDAAGNIADADSTPAVQIVDADGVTTRALSSTSVQHLSTGRYRLAYAVPLGAAIGTWVETWQVAVGGSITEEVFGFDVFGDAPMLNIGDDPNTAYTQAEIAGINILMAQLKCRLKNNAKAQTTDAYGQKTFVDCPIFTDAELLCFLNNSLSEFNQTPHWTSFSYDSPIIHERNVHVIVEGAFILALGAQMLVEAGREFTVTDNGITMQPPPLSTTMNNQFGALLTAHTERLKFIKCSMKPGPTGVGTFRVLAVSPAFLRLRHLRQRQII